LNNLAKTSVFFALILLYLSLSWVIIPAADTVDLGYVPRAVMRPDPATRAEWIEETRSAATAYMDPTVTPPPTGSWSILNQIKYVPSERDQWACGNCWAWAGTAVLEADLSYHGINYDRESVQFLNSYYNGGSGADWACCGGWLSNFVNFYSPWGYTVPWSNTNAAWADANGGAGYDDIHCNTGHTNVAGNNIAKMPAYPISSITYETITTHDVGQATAIANIKNVLLQHKAVWFAFFLANYDDWYGTGSPLGFQTIFFSHPIGTVVNYDNYAGHTADAYEGGHAVTIVGYNDDPNNKYWIVLNSWGEGYSGAGSRSGLFRMKMDVNYDDFYYSDSTQYYVMDSFYTLDINWTPLYSVVRGSDSKIYYRANLATAGAWTTLPGSTPDAPAAAVSSTRLHVAVRSTDSKIYYGYVTLSDRVFHGWSLISGSTPSPPGLAAASDNTVYLAVRGSDNGIYLKTLSSGGSWSAWRKLPGSTIDGPAVVVAETALDLAVRGTDGSSIYRNRMVRSTGVLQGWVRVSGSTSFRPALAARNSNEVYLAVRGSNGHVYVNKWLLASGWQGWTMLAGSTPSAPSITVAGSSSEEDVFVTVRGSDNHIYSIKQQIGTTSWSAWIITPGSTPSSPAITSLEP